MRGGSGMSCDYHVTTKTKCGIFIMDDVLVMHIHVHVPLHTHLHTVMVNTEITHDSHVIVM